MLPMESWRAGFDERYPIYQQIVGRFGRSLVKGELEPGERVPSIRDLALALKVNANTVQRAYQEMERDKLIYSQRGTGYFVMNDKHMVDRVRGEMVRETTTRFLEEMRALGYDNKRILAELTALLREGEGDHGIAEN